MVVLEPFSAQYKLVPDVRVETWDVDSAYMDFELYEEILMEIGKPVVGFTNGLHYRFEPSMDVMAGRCTIPRDDTNTAESDFALLIQD